jgi:hypothetical protein
MKFEIIELLDFSGHYAGIYSIIVGENDLSLFDVLSKRILVIIQKR